MRNNRFNYIIAGLLIGLSLVPGNLILTTILMIVTKKNCSEGVG